MKLKEKFEKVLKNSKPHFLKFDTNDCIEICDNFAIKFAEWLVIQYNEDIIYTEYNTKELLEIFKKSYKMWPRIPRALGSLERGGKEKRIERFKETGK